jgi:hypothetical protein
VAGRVDRSRVGNDILSPQLYHAATRHVVGLVKDITNSPTAIPCCNESQYESMIQFTTQSFVPFRRGGGHTVERARELKTGRTGLRVARKRTDGTA